MFTGITEEIGTIRAITENSIVVQSNKVLKGSKIGDSIAVDGICLTITKLNTDSFQADVSEETFKVTALKNLIKGAVVNLERAMAANGRFGGHMVSGHIDGQAVCVSVQKKGQFYNFKFELNSDCLKYIVKKGSIAINGISLTVAEICDDTIEIAVIPHTYENTNLKSIKTGDIVNIETDIIAKYIEKFLSTSDNKTGITMEFLAEHGF